MLKHIIYLVVMVSLGFVNDINGQSAPGLLGKRFTVSYDFNTHYNYSPPIFRIDGREPTLGNLFFVNKHLMGADYILSRSMSIGVDYGFHNQRLHDAEIQDNAFIHRVNTNELGLRLKVFPFERGGIAPIGYYFQLRAMRYSYESTMEFEPMGQSNLIEPYIFTYERGAVNTGAFGFGRQGILFGSILYNIGGEMALVLTEKNLVNLDDASENLRTSLLTGNLYKLKVGIAVPIF